MTEAILYTFRRCPYAIRARMALAYSGIQCELRELMLKDKPQDMLDHSPKGTVPVLITDSGAVIDESLDLMLWALNKNDPDHWLNDAATSHELIQLNDHTFKPLLDRYKYADRHPELSPQEHRELTLPYIAHLNELLDKHTFLIAEQTSLADTAIFPFIRQYAFVDKVWFDQLPYTKLQQWLKFYLNMPLFNQVMKKYTLFNQGFSHRFP
ncbi:glutathione S-transferase [Marinicella litoralis]|uniref:Glutathione S-transferase n=1 Tax=Marinicella litoralis TaxID=644220 RepID=A0A4R6XWT6_9GAMM|nr:glutathione S-transferase [Marinicella litoralis]TDR22627.1 glutathione S-transferase [Marinicella litoralis]